MLLTSIISVLSFVDLFLRRTVITFTLPQISNIFHQLILQTLKNLLALDAAAAVVFGRTHYR